jgi:hypothetical protein
MIRLQHSTQEQYDQPEQWGFAASKLAITHLKNNLSAHGPARGGIAERKKNAYL